MARRFQILIAASAMMLILPNVSAQNKACDALQVTEYARYDGPLGDRWAVLIVPAKTSRECALDLIRKLNQNEPKVHFELTLGPLHGCQWTVKFRKGDDIKLDRVDCRSVIQR